MKNTYLLARLPKPKPFPFEESPSFRAAPVPTNAVFERTREPAFRLFAVCLPVVLVPVPSRLLRAVGRELVCAPPHYSM